MFVLEDYRVMNESEDDNVKKKQMEEIRKNATEIGH